MVRCGGCLFWTLLAVAHSVEEGSLAFSAFETQQTNDASSSSSVWFGSPMEDLERGATAPQDPRLGEGVRVKVLEKVRVVETACW